MANKAAKKETGMFDFSNSTNLIKKTAKSINTQVQEVVSEVAGDLKENGSNLANKAYDKMTENINMEYLDLAKATKSANNYALKTAEEVVDGVLVSSEKWQGVAEKAIKGGLKMAAKQQEMVFDTMETVKGQLVHSSKRLKKLVYTKPAKATAKK